MSVYRAANDLGSVCIVCFAFGARAADVMCPRCGVPMPSPTAADTQAELSRRMKQRAVRAAQWRAAIAFGGAAVLAIAGFVILTATGLYAPSSSTVDVAVDGDPADTNLGWLFVFWPAGLLWLVFATLLQPIARKLVPRRPLPPVNDLNAVARWLGLRVLDERS